MLPVDQWLEIDRYALAMTRQMQQAAEADYGKLRIPPRGAGACRPSVRKISAVSTSTSSRTACTPRQASIQARPPLGAKRAVAHHATFVKLMAPILSFTAEEVWLLLSGDAEESVMLETWQPLPAQTDESELVAKWALIRNVRGEVTKALEDLRIEGKIGAPLQAGSPVACGW
jgi:isoleucyl-tRNA synthetase